MTIIAEFDTKKLISYLKPGHRVLIDFRHGLGDVIMFMPLYMKLKELYPDTIFHLKLAKGRGDFFDKTPDTIDTYDYVFMIAFFESCDKPGKLSKPEYCCVHELGLPFNSSLDFTWKPHECKSPFIGVNFQCNSNSSYNVPYRIAKQVWDTIVSVGLIPIEIYFKHPQFNESNQPYDFVTCSTRHGKATVEAFMGALQQCRAFVGVNSGSLCAATAMYPERTLHLHTKHLYSYYYKGAKVKTLDASGFSPFKVQEFVNWLKATL